MPSVPTACGLAWPEALGSSGPHSVSLAPSRARSTKPGVSKSSGASGSIDSRRSSYWSRPPGDAVALLFVSFLQVAEASRIGQVLANAQWFIGLQTFLFRYLALVFLMIGTGLVFYFVPNARTRFRDVWVGAILTGLLWRAALSGFSWYVRQNERMMLIHGSITTVVVFLLWIYISSVILMYGVEFTAAYARLRRHRTEQMPAAASPRT